MDQQVRHRGSGNASGDRDASTVSTIRPPAQKVDEKMLKSSRHL